VTRPGVIRAVIVVGCVAGLEFACRSGLISAKVLLAPSEMAIQLFAILRSGKANADIIDTVGNVALACVSSVIGGFFIGALVHAAPRLRQALDPFLASYYALPFFAFYPVLIVLFGIGRLPVVAIGFLFGVVAMIMSTLNGFDRIPRALPRTAQVYGMSGFRTLLKIKLPSAAPHLFTGVKLAVAYAFIGVIAAEFIMATSGLGYAIAYAFNNYDNRTMYALMLLIFILVIGVNAVFHGWEQRLLDRRKAR
jgi:NitT/TauT family transport system permease protein